MSLCECGEGACHGALSQRLADQWRDPAARRGRAAPVGRLQQQTGRAGTREIAERAPVDNQQAVPQRAPSASAPRTPSHAWGTGRGAVAGCKMRVVNSCQDTDTVQIRMSSVDGDSAFSHSRLALAASTAATNPSRDSLLTSPLWIPCHQPSFSFAARRQSVRI